MKLEAHSGATAAAGRTYSVTFLMAGAVVRFPTE